MRLPTADKAVRVGAWPKVRQGRCQQMAYPDFNWIRFGGISVFSRGRRFACLRLVITTPDEGRQNHRTQIRQERGVDPMESWETKLGATSAVSGRPGGWKLLHTTRNPQFRNATSQTVAPTYEIPCNNPSKGRARYKPISAGRESRSRGMEEAGNRARRIGEARRHNMGQARVEGTLRRDRLRRGTHSG